MTSEYTSADFDKACLMVGRFMYHFALLEGAVNTGVGKLLGLKNLEETIATSNMQFRAKIHILKTVVDLKGGSPEWLKDLEAIADFSAIRNTIAHNIFGPDEGGVKFLAVKAKGKLTFPNTVYSDAQFVEFWSRARSLREKLETIIKGLERPYVSLNSLLGQALTVEQKPALESPPNPLPQGGRRSPQSKRKGSSGTDQ